MASFEGSLYVVGDGVDPVRCQVLLEGADLVMSAAGQAIGAWPASDLGLHRGTDGIHMQAEGEELVFLPDDEPAFVAALGLEAVESHRPARVSRRARRADAKAQLPSESPTVTEQPERRPRTKKAEAPVEKTAVRRIFGLGRPRRAKAVSEGDDVKPSYRESQRLAVRKRRQQIAVGAGVLLVALAVFLPTVVAIALVVVGGVGILAAVAGMVEPLIAAKLPSRWQPTRLLVVSTLVLMGGVLVAAIAG